MAATDEVSFTKIYKRVWEPTNQPLHNPISSCYLNWTENKKQTWEKWVTKLYLYCIHSLVQESFFIYCQSYIELMMKAIAMPTQRGSSL